MTVIGQPGIAVKQCLWQFLFKGNFLRAESDHFQRFAFTVVFNQKVTLICGSEIKKIFKKCSEKEKRV